MLKAVMKYGNVAAKVRAMFGRALTAHDWQRLCTARDLPELAVMLHSMPGWAYAVSKLPAGAANAGTLVPAIRAQIRNEDERLYRLASREDKKYLDFAVCRVEYLQILYHLRRLIATSRIATSRYVAPEEIPEFVLKRSKMDFPVLMSATNISDVAYSARSTIFGDILSNADLSDYAVISVLLENKYYSAVYEFLQKEYSGISKALLTRSVGMEADMLNIMHVLRMIRFFPGSLDQTPLIPIKQNLNRKFMERLVTAGSEEAALALLMPTRWRFFAEDQSPGGLERRFNQVMEDFYRKLIREIGRAHV